MNDAGRRRERSAMLLAGAIALGLLLTGAPAASGFGFVTKWGRLGTGPGRFNHPVGVATDPAGNVYVTDMSGGSQRVLQKFTTRGVFVAEWGGEPGVEPISGPIATDRSGHVYVTVGSKARRSFELLKFDSRGRQIDRWPLVRPRRGRLPGGVATDSSGDVFVAVDTWIEKFDSKGRLLARWQATVPAHGSSFDTVASGLATDAVGDVYVLGALRVAKFTGDGSLIKTWGENEFKLPIGIATDRAGHVFVSDAARNRVMEYTTDGVFITQFGQGGSGNGQFRGAQALATDARGDLYVADTSNDRIQKFGEPSSAFNFVGTRLDRSRGSATLVADVAGIGRLDLTGAGIRTAHRIARGAGEVALPIAPTGTLWTHFGKDGRATAKIHVTTRRPRRARSSRPRARDA